MEGKKGEINYVGKQRRQDRKTHNQKTGQEDTQSEDRTGRHTIRRQDRKTHNQNPKIKRETKKKLLKNSKKNKTIEKKQ